MSHFFIFLQKNSENRPPKRPFRGQMSHFPVPVHQNRHFVDDWPSYPAPTGYLILHHFPRPPKRPFCGPNPQKTSLIHQTALFVDDTPPRHPKQETNRPLCRHTRLRPGISSFITSPVHQNRHSVDGTLSYPAPTGYLIKIH